MIDSLTLSPTWSLTLFLTGPLTLSSTLFLTLVLTGPYLILDFFLDIGLSWTMIVENLLRRHRQLLFLPLQTRPRVRVRTRTRTRTRIRVRVRTRTRTRVRVRVRTRTRTRVRVQPSTRRRVSEQIFVPVISMSSVQRSFPSLEETLTVRNRTFPSLTPTTQSTFNVREEVWE